MGKDDFNFQCVILKNIICLTNEESFISPINEKRKSKRGAIVLFSFVVCKSLIMIGNIKNGDNWNVNNTLIKLIYESTFYFINIICYINNYNKKHEYFLQSNFEVD